MKHAIRRVVTGHDRSGKAVVLIDGIAPNVKVRKGAGFVHSLLWVTDEAPAQFSHIDRHDRTIGVEPPAGGSILRMVVRGEIDLLLDDCDVRLTAGDVVVQQGTIHAWVNRGSRTCRVAFVLIDAGKAQQQEEPH